MLSCPHCRARVFAAWSQCKFCGTELQEGPIGAAVDPDELSSPPPAGPATTPDPHGIPDPSITVGSPAAGESPFDAEPDTGTDVPWWSTPTGVQADAEPAAVTDPSVAEAAPEVGTGAGQSEGPPVVVDDPSAPEPWPTSWSASPDQGDGDDPGGGALVPVEQAGGTWLPGPAPTVGDDEPVSGPPQVHDEDSWGTIGLEPVDWYPEPEPPNPGPPHPEPPNPASEPVGTGPAPPEAGGLRVAPWDPQTRGADRSTTLSGSDPGDDPWVADRDTRSDPHPQPGFDGDLFDPDAIFRDPEPVGSWSPDGDPEPDVGWGEPAPQWEAAAPDAWDTPVEPKGRPRGQAVLSREARMLLLGLILVITVGGAALWLKEQDQGHPSEWAPNVQGVADWVSETRELDFEHKVAVQTLASPDYDSLVEEAGRPRDDSIRQELADDVAMWRALGALGGNPEARLAWVEAQRPDLGAFYDVRNGKLNLRSGADLDAMGPGLAGALSIALDDQHGDLAPLQDTGIGENPVFEVVAGTSALIRRDYADTRSADEDRSVDELEQLPSFAGSDRDLEFLVAQPLLRVGLGDGFVQFIRALEGVEAGNELITDPPTSSQQVMFPLTYISGRGPLSVDSPTVPDDAEELASGTLGASTWYLLLAGHAADGDLGDVFDFADRWAGDQYVAYRMQDGRVCVTDVLRGADEPDLRALRSVLETWRDAVPGDRIRIEATGDLGIAVTGCDPGAETDRERTGSYGDSVLDAIVRSHLAAGYYADGVEVDNGPNPPIFTPEIAWCMAQTAAGDSPTLRLWQLVRQNGEEYREVTLDAGDRCGSHLVGQLFADADTGADPDSSSD